MHGGAGGGGGGEADLLGVQSALQLMHLVLGRAIRHAMQMMSSWGRDLFMMVGDDRDEDLDIPG